MARELDKHVDSNGLYYKDQ